MMLSSSKPGNELIKYLTNFWNNIFIPLKQENEENKYLIASLKKEIKKLKKKIIVLETRVVNEVVIGDKSSLTTKELLEQNHMLKLANDRLTKQNKDLYFENKKLKGK